MATTTKKTTTKKTTTKTAATKNKPLKKVTPKKIAPKPAEEMVNVDSSSLLDALLPPPPKGAVSKPVKEVSAVKKAPTKKATTKKTTTKTAATKTQTSVSVDAKKNEKKLKSMTKDEKLMYKKLWEHFNYVANLTMVIEERMMDTKLIPDLTIGELHVLETVDRLNGKPMSKIAAALKVTVGSLTIGVNRLVAKEYLLRIRDENDHRVVNLSVTPKAKKVLKTHDKFHEDILLGVLDGITLRDATKVMAQFNRVLENYINPKERTYASSSKKPTK
ncbi:MAG: MarR family transcriptional regulator [Bacilli bacterium]|nr:MarR family transcriptional regulator [Bacilli bacterium]